MGVEKGKATKPPFSTLTIERSISWRDVKDLVFRAIDYGSPTDFEAKKLARASIDLLARKQAKSSLNLNMYQTIVGSLEHLTDDEIRRLALQCISRCTDSEENSGNIVSIAKKVGAIHTRYFDYKYRGKPYIIKKPLSVAEQEIATATVTGATVEDMVDDTDGVFDIAAALGTLPYNGEL